jgi:hypothetical protein
MNLFTYGSLMFEPVWSTLVRQPHASMLARIDDFDRQGVLDELYPGLIHKPGAHTQGRLWLGLNDSEVAVLDAFEGVSYHRQSVQVAISARRGGQTRVPAQVYVFSDTQRLTGRPWDMQRFRDFDLERFLAHERPGA